MSPLTKRKPAEEKNPEFDQFAESYEADLQRGVSLSGERPDYFAKKRVEWTREAIRPVQDSPQHVMDFGCGVGGSIPFLRQSFPGAKLLGVDTSQESLRFAESLSLAGEVQFELWQQFKPSAALDVIYTNGVFHHIPPGERPPVVQKLRESLSANGLISLWENNPWNPGTRWVMSRIPFDRDAQTLSYLQSKQMLIEGGFEILDVSFHFIFPNFLKSLRFLEKPFRSVPIGAQYHVLARKV